MKVLRTENNLVLDVAPTIEFVNDVIKVEYSNGYFYYIATDDRFEYEILDRDDIPNNFYPKGYYLVGDTWTYIPKPILPDPTDN